MMPLYPVTRALLLAFPLAAITLWAGSPVPADVQVVPVSHIVAPTASYAFVTSKYVFSVHWQFFNAGTSTVALQRSGKDLHVIATADSAGMPDKLFKVHDHYDAEVNPHNFCTGQVNKHNQEGPHERDISVLLDYPHAKSEVNVTDLKTSETKHSEFDIPPCVTDVVSGFFYVASLPLQPGFSETFPVNDNGKTSNVEMKVEGREKVKGPTGEYETVRTKVAAVDGPMRGKGTLWVWFTDDSRRIPVQMKSKLGFATLVFQLQSVGTERSN